jgi:hypothetical protein
MTFDEAKAQMKRMNDGDSDRASVEAMCNGSPRRDYDAQDRLVGICFTPATSFITNSSKLRYHLVRLHCTTKIGYKLEELCTHGCFWLLEQAFLPFLQIVSEAFE